MSYKIQLFQSFELWKSVGKKKLPKPIHGSGNLKVKKMEKCI